MPWPDAVSGPADQAHRLAQRIAAMSDGRYRIDVVPGAGNGLAAVRAGEADLYHGSEHDHLDQHRALAYFAGLPGDRGIAARHLTAWMLVGGGQTLWDELAGDFGIKALLAGHSGDQALFRRHAPHCGHERAGRREGRGDRLGARRGARLRARAGGHSGRQT